MQAMKKTILLGATGLVGQQLLQLLLRSDHYDKVTVFSRKPLEAHPKLQQIICSDLSEMNQHAATFEGVEDVFCCLGTTIRVAKTRERFREVDYDYPLLAAQLAKAAGVKRYLLVSAMGANTNSNIFYSQVKGEIETAIQMLQLPSVCIFRPSLLLGNRTEFRFGERLSILLSRPLEFIWRGKLLKYKPIHASDVAMAMSRVAQMFLPGTHIFENDQLHHLSHPVVNNKIGTTSR
jgi:uncharacterized protein YbjT (DUF2867 family)